MARPNPDLTAERLRDLLSYDAETGHFEWRNPVARCLKPGMKAGCVAAASPPKKLRYIVIGVLNRTYYAHRLAWLYVHGEWPGGLIDHINGDGLDNRIANLRIADAAQNAINSKPYSTNRSGLRGVSWNSRTRKWLALIHVDGRCIYLGLFADKAAAGKAYRTAAIKNFGEFAEVGARL